MLASVGKHKGRSMEELMVKEPQYIHWLIQQSPSGGLLAMKTEAKRLIQKFDSKPFTCTCFNCKKPATRFSVYGDNVAPWFWCDDCDPYSQGAIQGKLQIFSTYDHALVHVEFFCNGRTSDYRDLIKDLAKAKGLTRATATQLATLFA